MRLVAFLRRFVFALAVTMFAVPAAAQVSVTALGASVTENFNTLANSGTTNVLTLPGWFLTESGGGARDNEQYGADNGGSATGDTYSYGLTANPERALGGLQSGTLIPIFGASFTNNTGLTITSLEIAYTGEQWRLGALGRVDRIDFQYSLNATTLTTGAWVDVDALDFTAPVTGPTTGALNGNAAANRTSLTHTILGLSIPNGTTFWIRWTDFNPSGSDDGLAVDDFSLTAPTGVAAIDPSGVGSANPTSVLPGGSVLLAVAVTPGGNPTSSGLAVAANLSAIGGSASQAFFDDGTNGDVTATDNVFSFQATVAAGTSPGVKSLPAAITDAENRSANATIALSVLSDIVISQVYGGGGNSGATLKNDFIELFNKGTSTISISGWSVQYTSANGTSWQKTDLTGSIPAGGYYLIREAAGAGGSVELPTPDASGGILMSATAAKVALVNDTTLLSGSGCPFAASVVDFVGYGSASCAESSPAPGLSNTEAALRGFRGCIDTNDNSADFDDGAPDPRNSAFPAHSCTPVARAIHDIQGSGSTSPHATTLVSTSGIVTGRKSNGFFLQTPDDAVDGDALTSEGIFVFTSSNPPASAAVGNSVSVVGLVHEFVPSSDLNSPSTTELIGPPTVALLTTGNALPAPITLMASDTNPAGSLEQLEKYEGMRVHVDSLTAVSPTQGDIDEANATSITNGVFYGVITGIDRPFREKGVQLPDPLPPGSPCCVPRFDGNPERLRVDSDGQQGGVPLELTSHALVTNLVGPLDYSFRTYTILPDPPPALQPVVSGLISAIAVPVPDANEFTIASFNMQRFFDTTPTPGAPVLAGPAFDARLNKASLAIRNVLQSPDIIGVEEVENLATLQAIASKLNSDAGSANPNYQAYLEEGNDVGGIDSGFLVKRSRVDVIDVTQEGKDTIFDLDGTLLNDRPPLVLRAEINGPVGLPLPVTVIVNHLRSLNGIDDPGAGGDRVRRKRLAQAEFLANLIQARQTDADNPNQRIISVGDYNAFAVSDGYVDVIGTIKGVPAPADEVVLESSDLVNPDLTNLVDKVSPELGYSYSFDGNIQTLDHILANAAAMKRFSRFHVARNDADFPESYRNDSGRPERISDHDMPVGYFAFPGPPTLTLLGPNPMSVEFHTSFSDPGATASDADLGDLTAEIQVTGGVDTQTLGSYTLTYTVSNRFLTTTVTRTVNVVDTTAPVITAVKTTPHVLWPPNGRLVPVLVRVTASDASGPPSCRITDVDSDERVGGRGRGHFGADWIILGDRIVLLRAEREGRGDGRTYTITVTCRDASGNEATGIGTVVVPHDRGRGGPSGHDHEDDDDCDRQDRRRRR